MLALFVGLLVATAPLLNGSWDLWAQSLLLLAVAAGSGVWLASRLAIGYVPVSSPRTLLWAAVLAALGGLSAHSSPLAAYAVPAWHVWLGCLWIFVAITDVSKDGRSAIDEALRVAGWVLVLLAFYQRFHLGLERPMASLLNQNAFAGTILMLLPLAVQKRDWVLSGCLLVCLWWAHSVGAWLGLAGALLLTRRSGAAGSWFGATVGFACLVAIYGKLQSPDVLHRVEWWKAAARMAAERPWLGFGAGTFAFALPSVEEPGRALSTLFAHSHLLEVAAESGLPYAALWVAGIIHLLRRGGPHKRFGALAVLIHSLGDYALSIPANLWLFAYFTASSISESSRGFAVPRRWKLPACALTLAVTAAVCLSVARLWEADRLRASGLQAAGAGRSPEALELLERSARAAEHPQTSRAAAELELRLAQAEGRGTGRLLAAAAHLERAAALDPYRASTWTSLERLYRRLDRPELARAARERGAAFCPSLRTP